MNASIREERLLATRSGVPSALLRISFVEFVTLTAALMALTALSIDIMLPALPQIGSAPVLLSGLAIFIAGSLGALLSGTFTMLLAARLIQGVGAALPRVVAVAVVRDLYGGRQMARVMSFAMMVFILIPVFAPSLGQALTHLGDWHWTFFVLLAMASIVAVWAGLRLPETAEQALGAERALNVRDAFFAAILDPLTIAYGIAGGFMLGCLLAYVASAQQVFVEVFHLGQAFPIVFGAIASAMAIASFVNARLVERLGMRRVSHTALAGFTAVSLILLAASAFGVAKLPVFAALVFSAFFLFGLIAPNFNAIATEPQGHNAGMASSVIGSLSTAIGALAGGLVGRSFDGTVLPIAVGFAVCSLITCAIVVFAEDRENLFGSNRAV